MNPNPQPEPTAPPQVLEETQPPFQPIAQAEAEAEAKMRKMSRRSFLWAALAVGSGYGGLRWLDSRRMDEGIPWPLRRALQVNEEVGRDFFSPARLAPTFTSAQVRPLRLNGDIGLDEDFDASTWKLSVEGLADEKSPTKEITLAQIKALPRVEMISELRCIEGWATIVQWAGARMSDFMQKFPPATQSGAKLDLSKPQDLPAFVGMTTPDGAYYVGLEMEAALHPQTLLCYEMNGAPLKPEHGAPLRLAIPVKYGVKNIKRIGTIAYTNHRPADYWAELGYDYYAGH